MTRPLTRPQHHAVLFAAALALGLAAAPAAQAFQFESANGAASPPQNFMDLGMPSAADQPASKLSDNKPAIGQSDFSVHFNEGPAWGGSFGGGSFHQRYNFNSQFDRYNPGQ
jgi:hypothetical protein